MAMENFLVDYKMVGAIQIMQKTKSNGGKKSKVDGPLGYGPEEWENVQ